MLLSAKRSNRNCESVIRRRRRRMGYQVDKIDPSKSVMIVVDMQNDFVAEGAKLRSAQAAAMVPKLAATLDFCRANGIRVVYTAHAHRRDGCDMGMFDDLYPPIADRSSTVQPV